MEFPNFQDQSPFPILSSILQGNPTPNPQIQTTMFPPPQALDPIPPPPSSLPPPSTQLDTNNPMLQISNHPDFAYTLDPASASASASNFMDPEWNPTRNSKWGWEAEGISLAPNTPIDANYSITPFYNISTPCLGQSSLLSQDLPQNQSFIRDPINQATVTANVTIAPQNSAYPLHGLSNNNNNSTQIMLDSFPPKTPSMPTHHDVVAAMPCSSSISSSSLRRPPPPLPPPLPPSQPILGENDQIGGGVMKRQRKRAKEPKITYIKGQWSSEEDRILMRLMNEEGTKKWSEIAEKIKGRNSKQCRERWCNHLRPDIRKGPWTNKEDMMLIMAHQEVGNKWAEIAKRIPGRPENSVKNHWNATKRRRNEKVPQTYIMAHNRRNISDGSTLQAYIKTVTPTTTPPEEDEELEEEEFVEETPNNNNHDNDDDQIMNGLFNNDNDNDSLVDWATELFGGGGDDAPVNAANFDF